MGQDLEKMMQEAPVLTLDPFAETKEEVAEVKEEAQTEEVAVLSPEEQRQVAEFAEKIDLTSTNMICSTAPERRKRLRIFRKMHWKT